MDSDTLGFRIELKDKPPSRRNILSTISSVYDPLGIVAPVILVGKQLCRRDTDWDDPVPEDILTRWEKWRTELSLLESAQIPRCVKPPGFGSPVLTEVHSFADASESGLGQVSYLRFVTAKNEVRVSFLMLNSAWPRSNRCPFPVWK